MKSSTVRSMDDQTTGDFAGRATELARLIATEWQQDGVTDLVVSLRRHPAVLRDRSVLLNLAIEEFRKNPQGSGVDLETHCSRFEEFGSSIQHCILRQLRVTRYFDNHPDLLTGLCEPDWPSPGDEFCNFLVLEELGLGASAKVYLCRQTDVGNRRVVVKTSPFSSFEASFLGRLSHENIMPVYSTGLVEDRQLYYLCMPYCGRSTLSDLLDVAFENGCPRTGDAVDIAARRWTHGETWPPEKARFRLAGRLRSNSYVDRILDIAIQIAKALEFAHDKKILHGDLKPSNVLLTPGGRVLLLDFNLSQDATSPVLYGGTLPYMPPERVRLVAGDTACQPVPTFDVRSDIYSFGALLYHLLVGRPPLVPSTDDATCRQAAACLLSQMADVIPSVRAQNSFVSRRLEAIVHKCLAFHPNERPATISEVATWLQAERRSLAAIKRIARLRPVLFSSAVLLPLVALAGASAHIATRPPQYLANYNAGLRLASSGQQDKAVEYLTEAVAAQPDFVPARFELARTLMAQEEYDRAINHFMQLARNHQDPHGMSYVGYCFNLKRMPSAAIVWYEEALAAGASSVAVYNNLAASYLTGHTHLSHREWLARVQDCLHRALEQQPTSPIIRLNALVHAETEARFDRSYDPFPAFPHAQALLASAPHDRIIQLRVALWYRAVLRRYQNSIATLIEEYPQFTPELHQKCSELTREIELHNPNDTTKSRNSTTNSPTESSLASLRHHFLEPLSLD